MEVIYLVGQISSNYEITYKWREYVVDRLKGVKDEIQIINPCSNPFNKDILKYKEFGIDYGVYTKEFGVEVITSKDYTYIKRCDIAIVNMNQYDLNKPLIGSYFEMAWLYAAPEKTVIAFADNLESYECKHPFVKQTVDCWCKNEEEACVLVERYFTRGGQ